MPRAAAGSTPESDYEDDLQRIAGGSELARIGLETGDANIADMPDELMAEDATEKRVAWIEGKASDSTLQILELRTMLGFAQDSRQQAGEEARR